MVIIFSLMAVGDDDCKQMRKKSQFTYVHLSLSFCFSNITHNCWPRKKIIFTFDIISITQIGKFTTTKQKNGCIYNGVDNNNNVDYDDDDP